MSEYEYSVIQMAAGSRVTMFNERMDHMVQDGWEPFLMSGDTTLNVLMRRPRRAAAARQPQAVAAAAAQRPPVAPAPVGVSVPQAAAPVGVSETSDNSALNQQ